ncbi:MAG: glycosyltransferase family 2 protein [Alloprevotella sp.]|nr:glycosyltransferase family 2 protein [Alloprevotella sp.]
MIPYCNRSNWLPRTLDSLRKIVYRPIALIFVDNLSTDNSRALVEAFKENYETSDFSIRLIDEPHQGASAARNAGLKLVDSTFVYFFDSDDEISPEYFNDALPYLKDADIVACATKMHFADGRNKVRKVFYNGSVSDQILVGQLSTQGMLIRTEFLRNAGGWNSKLPLWNDWELGARLLKLEPRIFWLTKHYHYIMQHADSLTGSNRKSNLSSYLSAFSAVEDIALTPAEQETIQARKVILSAELAREKAYKEANELQASIPKQSIALRLLYLYARFIHRGSWWIYRFYATSKYGREY